MWEGILKNRKRRKQGSSIFRRFPDSVRCMLMRAFILKSVQFLKMWIEVGIMSMLFADGTGLLGLQFWIPWHSRVFVPLLLWRRGCRKLVHIWMIFLGGSSYDYCLLCFTSCCFRENNFNCLLFDSMNKARPC